jgi:hypothetical protein
VNNELERTWQEAELTQFKIISQHSNGKPHYNSKYVGRGSN